MEEQKVTAQRGVLALSQVGWWGPHGGRGQRKTGGPEEEGGESSKGSNPLRELSPVLEQCAEGRDHPFHFLLTYLGLRRG